MKMLFLLLLCCLGVRVESAFNFLTLGDWGGAALGGQDLINVYAVANAMATAASTSKPSWVINVGDSFYWCGIQNTTDFQLSVDFEKPYSAPSLQQLPFYGVLGNHEFGYSPQSVIDYGKVNPRWVMPAHYYTKRMLIDSDTDTHVSMIFIDSSPCVQSYRDTNPANWDPCSTTYPTCSLKSTDDDFEGKCEFHSNIMQQDCAAQFSWFKQELAAVPKDDWLIVVGHHPLDELDVEDFTSALQDRGFSIYFNGHSHTLSQYTLDKVGLCAHDFNREG